MPTRTEVVEGTAVHLLDIGSGRAVLLLHGSGPGTTGSGAWASTCEALGATHRLVAPDQASFGGSPMPAGSRGGLRTWTDRAAALMDSLDIETYAVVGHSMGGAVALSLAATRPERVTRVVAISTMGAPGAPLSPALDALWAAEPGPAGARDMLSRLLLDQSLVTDAAIAARAEAMTAGAHSYAPLFPPPRERWAEDLTLSAETLAGLVAPVLLIHGADDQVTPMATSVPPLLDHLPDVRLEVVERCGHVPMLESPVVTQRLLAEFLAVEA